MKRHNFRGAKQSAALTEILSRVSADYPPGFTEFTPRKVPIAAYHASRDMLDGAEDDLDEAHARITELSAKVAKLGRLLNDTKEAAAELRTIRYHQERCRGKRRYETRIETRSDAGRWGHSPYRCEFCQGWHLTKGDPSSSGRRIDSATMRLTMTAQV